MQLQWSVDERKSLQALRELECDNRDGSIMIHNSKGELWLRMEDTTKAVQEFEQAIEGNHLFDDPHHSLIAIYEKKKLWGKGIHVCENLTAFGGSRYWALSKMAEFYRQMGNKAKIDACYREILTAEPGYPEDLLSSALNTIGYHNKVTTETATADIIVAARMGHEAARDTLRNWNVRW